MAEKRRLLDVWLVDGNTVYKQVPFTVVADWVQQGRLIEEDRVRPVGTDKWYRLGSVPVLAAYLPKAEPFRAEDKAEALEPVAVDFAWKHRADEDDDVDMIPLIDISLVLLIFFMMTAAPAVATFKINVPEVTEGMPLSAPKALWLAIDKGPDGQPLYTLGQDEAALTAEDQRLNQAQVMARLDARLKQVVHPLELRLEVERNISYGELMEINVALARYLQTELNPQGKLTGVTFKVSEKR